MFDISAKPANQVNAAYASVNAADLVNGNVKLPDGATVLYKLQNQPMHASNGYRATITWAWNAPKIPGVSVYRIASEYQCDVPINPPDPRDVYRLAMTSAADGLAKRARDFGVTDPKMFAFMLAEKLEAVAVPRGCSPAEAAAIMHEVIGTANANHVK